MYVCIYTHKRFAESPSKSSSYFLPKSLKKRKKNPNHFLFRFCCMISGRCAACKYLRRKCRSDCIFSPFFPSNNPQRFSIVHQIYGASNVAKFLHQIPVHLRAEAAETLFYEAKCRIEDPVYGIVGIISQLQHQLHVAETQLAKTRAEIAVLASNVQDSEAQLIEMEPIQGPNCVGLSAPAHLFNSSFSKFLSTF